MPVKLQITASLQVTNGKLLVGANPRPANKFQLVITNQGQAVERPTDGTRLIFYFTGKLGPGENDLFLNDADASVSKIKLPKGWRADWDFPAKAKGTFAVKIYTFNDPILKQGEVLNVEFSEVVSKTAPGDANLGFGTDPTQSPQPLAIRKEMLKPGIIVFYSDPPEGTLNLPGNNIELKWTTFQLSDRKLEQVGISDPLPVDFEGDQGSYIATSVTTDTSFRLTGYSPQRDDRQIQISVLTSGWYDLQNTILQGNPAYPQPGNEEEANSLDKQKSLTLEPTQLFNANDQMLYGIFRYTFAQRERSFLFRTANPFARWNLVDSSVPNQDGAVPEGFASSPGIYFDDQIWLIGGSQIDPDNTSNIVWRLDPQNGTWRNLGAAPWKERMGHAAVIYQNQIWIMGGRDSGGNALNDVWRLDSATSKWTMMTQKAPWTPRCLFQPANFDGKIWLYGGAKAPFASELYNDLYVYSPETQWVKKDLTGVLSAGNKKPIASCLQVFNNKLHLFGKFRTDSDADVVEPFAFSLDPGQFQTWETFSNDGLNNWGSNSTFSYQLVNFQEKLLIAKALGYGPNLVLKVFVPSSPADQQA
jgi:Kelch motif